MSFKSNSSSENGILEQFFEKASKYNLPLVTTFEITENCNLKCKHCYNFDRIEKKFQKSNNYLNKDKILNTIEELALAGAMYLNFTGGEALLHPHLFEFIKKAREFNLEVRLKTNGILLTEEICQKLSDLDVAGLDISLYGYSENSYLAITGVKNSFQKAIEGIAIAKKFNFDIAVSVIIHKLNFHELESMINYCKERQLRANFSTEMTERYDGTFGAKNFEITIEQFESGLIGKFSDIFMINKTENSFQCSCAKTVCGINSKGEVFPCIGAPIPSGNLQSQSFKEIWEKSEVLNNIRNLKNEDFKSCVNCNVAKFCNRSSGAIYVNTKNYTGCDESTLLQAQSRKNFFENFMN